MRSRLHHHTIGTTTQRSTRVVLGVDNKRQTGRLELVHARTPRLGEGTRLCRAKEHRTGCAREEGVW